MLLEPFRSVSAQTVLETYTYGVKSGSEVETPPPLVDPPPPLLAPPTPPPPHRAFAPPPTQCCPHQPPVHPPPPPVASYWPSQPLAGRLRAIRPTLVGYVFDVTALILEISSTQFVTQKKISKTNVAGADVSLKAGKFLKRKETLGEIVAPRTLIQTMYPTTNEFASQLSRILHPDDIQELVPTILFLKWFDFLILTI